MNPKEIQLKVTPGMKVDSVEVEGREGAEGLDSRSSERRLGGVNRLQRNQDVA